jgi:N-acyl amino acid synthase of PEP-CTERM/exosortase system
MIGNDTVFDNPFEAFLADTSQSKKIHYHLRYKIYCVEKRYENPEAYPDLQECDANDVHAAHFIIRSRDSAMWLGAMRLIVGQPAVLPITTLATIEAQAIDRLTNKITAEASRLCVLPAQLNRQRSQLGSSISSVGSTDRSNRSSDIFHASWVSLTLIRAARRYCLDHGIRYCFFFAANSLAQMLTRVGMEIHAIGPAVEHRGLRRPHIHDFRDGYTAMEYKSPLVHQMFQRGPAYRRFSQLTDTEVSEYLPPTVNPRGVTRSRTWS